MANIIVGLIILSILVLAIMKVVSEKRKGVKCVGCASGSECSSKKGNNIKQKQFNAQQIEIKELT